MTLSAAAPEDDRFADVILLGEGGHGRVYRAYDRLLGRPVALKRFVTDRSRARLLAEARAQAQVSHPHVCRVYEVTGDATVVMQLVEGVPLDQAARALSVAEKVAVIIDVARAVHAAHQLGLIHRDLKPGNILVERGADDDGPHAYVTDFGMALAAGELPSSATTSGAVDGTPQYLAPEQLREQRVDARADVYALGATLYELLAGRPPFTGSLAEILPRVLADEPPRLRDVARDLETIARKCLEKDPARRYASARALADDLERWSEGEPLAARAASLAYRARKAIARRPALAAVIGVAAAGAAVLFALLAQARARAGERLAFARDFGAQVSAVEQTMRDAYTLPFHDVRREQAVVRAQLDALADEMDRAGEVARGPGEYALGRGALALHDLAAARAHLERAWAAGDRAPEVAYALDRRSRSLSPDRAIRKLPC